MKEEDRLTVIRSLLQIGTAAELGFCVFSLPDEAGNIVVERAEHGIHIWVSGYPWPVAMVDLHFRRADADPEELPIGPVLVQLSDYQTGGDPLQLCYLNQDYAVICDGTGEIKEVLDVQ